MRSETACAQAHRQPRRFMQRPAAPTAPARGRAYLALRQQLGAGHHLLLAAARAHGRQQHARLALRRLPKKSAGVGALGLELGFTVTMPIGKSRRPTSLLSQQRVKSPSAPVTTQRGDWGLSRHPPVRRGERGRWGGRAARGGGGGGGPRPPPPPPPAQQERRACCLPRSLMAPASTGWDHALRSSCTAGAPAHTCIAAVPSFRTHYAQDEGSVMCLGAVHQGGGAETPHTSARDSSAHSDRP